MKLQGKIWLASLSVVLAIMAGDFLVSRQIAERNVRAELEREARDIHGMLMAMRRVYQQQFLDSGVPLNPNTVGFLPAHSISRIAADFPNWVDSDIRFNNVSDRPRNPANRADADEMSAIAYFRQAPTAQYRVNDIVDARGRNYLHFTTPIWIEQSCLSCHGKREAAQPSIAEAYTDAYGYKLGDLRGVVSIKVPMASVHKRINDVWLLPFWIRLAGYAVLFAVLGWLVERLVTRRLVLLEKAADRMVVGDYDARCPVQGNDEVTRLARGFNDMADAVQHSMRALAAHRDDLEAEVDARTRALRDSNRQLEAARLEAEAGSQAKSVFLANMSHEIRTPMNAITGMTYLVRREGNLSPRQAERLQKIDAAGHHLLGLINDVLDLSKIEAGKMQIAQAPLSPTAILHDVQSMLMERAQAKGLALTVEPAKLPNGLLGDAIRLTQALVNLASNGIKFTESGTVCLRTALVETHADDVVVRFEVTDSGIGIEADAQARIFEPFEQASTVIGRRYGGTGLGLAITRRLAELMGGSVGVDSRPGIGSTFWFTARLSRWADPEVAATAEPTAARATIRARYANTRLLLVEDDAINREVLLEMLDDLGLNIDIAEDGVQAVEKVRDTAYDLILMDMQMPRLGGLEATRQIRQLSNGAAVTIVAVTANAFDDDRQRCLAAGMDDFIAKPVDPEELFDKLARHLDRRAASAGDATGKTMDFQLTQTWHAIFALHLRDAVEHRRPLRLNPDEVSDAGRCRLGGWLDSRSEQYGGLPEFRELVRQHRAFHQVAGEMVKADLRGQTERVHQIEHDQFDVVSRQVVAAIDALGLALRHGDEPAAAGKAPASLWNDALKLGVPVLDEQHRAIAELVAHLAGKSTMSLASEEANTLLQQLGEIMTLHCQTEEAVLQRLGTSAAGMSRLREEHDRLLRELTNLHMRAMAAHPQAIGDFLPTLNSWVLDHVGCVAGCLPDTEASSRR